MILSLPIIHFREAIYGPVLLNSPYFLLLPAHLSLLLPPTIFLLDQLYFLMDHYPDTFISSVFISILLPLLFFVFSPFFIIISFESNTFSKTWCLKGILFLAALLTGSLLIQFSLVLFHICWYTLSSSSLLFYAPFLSTSVPYTQLPYFGVQDFSQKIFFSVLFPKLLPGPSVLVSPSFTH